jgi:muramoyltetrapeptide carboxypeptidase
MAVMIPRALAPGARIAIVSTASACSRDEFERGIAELRRLGYEPTYSESVFETSMFTAGTSAVRASDFRRAWDDPSISAIVATRGGYGSVQILPELEGWRPQRAPKLFVGYSDNTSLLTWLTCQCGIATLHGPMIDGRLAKGAAGYDQDSFLSLLQGRGAGLELRPDGLSVLQPGEASGPLFGGTLTQLVSSLGTPYAFDPPEGCLLFIEDVNERPYRIDRMLTQLLLAGVLRRARGLVFGEMRGCDEPGGTPTAYDAIRAFTADFPGPVIFGFPSGHTTGPCWTLPLGVRVSVNASRCLLRVEESPVA